MKINVAVAGNNSIDWDRFQLGGFDRPSIHADPDIIDSTLALGDLADPLGYDGIWVPDHFGTP